MSPTPHAHTLEQRVAEDSAGIRDAIEIANALIKVPASTNPRLERLRAGGVLNANAGRTRAATHPA
jgi:hypothetical protein